MADENTQNQRIVQREIDEEMQVSYLDYAMSVLVSRALPDIRDGLKPVHRRVLYTMYRLGLLHNKAFRKSATIIGNTMARYHPHGDSSIYDALVRMAQDFSLRYPLVDGQGNWGCFTKDTKVRLTDGRSLSFEELRKEQRTGKRHWTFSFNSKENKIEITEIKKPRLTRRNSELVELELDNGEKIRCTPDHRFMLRDGSYREAKDLQSNDSLMPLYTKLSDGADDKNMKGYLMALQPFENEWQYVHRLSDEWNLQEKVYEKNSGRIRHHLDINKLNNNPDNIKRLQWAEHWKIHSKLASFRHKNDPVYVKKLAEGRRKYIENNKAALSQRAINLNKKLWKSSEFRIKHSKRMKALWKDKDYREFMRKASSKNLKSLWQKKDFQQLLSDLKSKEMKIRWQDKTYRKRMQKRMKQISLQIWSNQEHRAHISKLTKKMTNDPAWKKKQSAISKSLWKNSEYRAKFAEDHFSKMAKILWSDEKVRIMQRDKAIRQWQNPAFRKKVIRGATRASKLRLQQNPTLMKELAAKAKISLRTNWKNPAYRERVIRSKILGFVSTLLQKYPNLKPELYEKERTNNGVPKIDNALKYFDDFSALISEAKIYNHKIVNVSLIEEKEDVYDITVEPHHNFLLDAGVFVHNSVDGDRAAAFRYTEARLKAITEELLADIDKKTVDFVPNFDGSTQEPTVLPSKFPNLLVNGSSGIAVGMATNIPPHNLGEVTDAVIMKMDKPDTSIQELMKVLPGPDFPTGAIIRGRSGIVSAYNTGRGLLRVRAKTFMETIKDRNHIIVSEIPYQVNKSLLIEEMANRVRDKVIPDISDIRDESDRDGMRIVIQLKKNSNADVVLNQLFSHSRLESTIPVALICLIDGTPVTVSIDRLIDGFITHRKSVVTKRCTFELNKASERLHIVAGLLTALQNIDAVVQAIKESKDAAVAKTSLMQKFSLSEKQSVAVLEMRLQKLSSLEQQALRDEDTQLKSTIAELQEILASPQKITDIIKKELTEIKEKYSDARRTQIEDVKDDDFVEEDLIKPEKVAITISHSGYAKRTSLTEYKQQHRGGKGVIAASTKEGDFLEYLFVANTHSYILFFTNQGIVHWLKVYEIPDAGRNARGKAIVNLLNLSEGEQITAFVPVAEFNHGNYLIMATKNGTIKKTELSAYSNPRKGGIIAITLEDGDELISVKLTDGTKQIILATKNGHAVRFKESDIRDTGRSSKGVRGIKLRNDAVIGLVVADDSKSLLTVCEKGYGKRTPASDYRLINRGGYGVINIQTTERNGKVVGISSVSEDDEIIFISRHGIMIRVPSKDISIIGRNTQGARIMRLNPNDVVVAVAKIVKEESKTPA